jgi:PAS domain S-box-containing protein
MRKDGNYSGHLMEKLQALFDGLIDPVYIADPETYEVLFANKRIKEAFGENILGKKCYRVFQNLNKPCPFCTNKYIFGENLGKTYIWEFQNRKNKRWYKCIDKAFQWFDGRYVRFEIAIDISEHKRIEEELRETNARLSTLIHAIPDVVYFKDAQGRNLIVNEAFEKLVGLPRNKIIGKTDDQLFPPDLAEYCRKSDLETLRTLRIVCTEEQTTTKDGEKIFFETLKAPIFDYKGNVIGIVGVSRDITKRKQIEEALKENERRYRNLFETAPVVIYTLSAEDGTITSLNPAFEKLTGWSRKEWIGKSFTNIIHPKDLLLAMETFQRVLRGETPPPYELRVLSKNGDYLVGEFTSIPLIENRKIVGEFGVVRDVTEYKRMEVERRRFEESLSVLNKYGQSLNMAKKFEDIYILTLKAMKETLGFEYASFLILEGKTLLIAKCHGYPKKPRFRLPLDGEKGITVKAAKTGRSIYVPDVRKEKAYVKGGENMLSELAVPIKIGGKVLGVLNVESKRLAAFNKNDKELLEILAAHAAIAMSNLQRQEELRKLSKKLKNLMKSSTEVMRIKNMRRRLRTIAKAIRNFGWKRVVISLRDENLEIIDLVTFGLTEEEVKLLWERRSPGHIWRERLGPKFKQYKIGEFYYLPWNDPWIRENVHKIPPDASSDNTTTYAGVPSRISPEKMVDWHPQDMLYAPLRTPQGKIVGILSMDDPVDGKKPTRDSLSPLELFLHQAAIAIENTQLINSLRLARAQLKAYAEQLEQKVQKRTEELKKSQEALLKAQRLAVIGELAGMVGHDLRNPLTSIQGAIYYLKRKVDSKIDDKTKEMLNLVEKNVAYSNKIINDLLDYSREIKLEVSETTPKALVKEALDVIEIPKNIQVVDLTKNEPKIKVDQEKIKRVFINIIKNAVEAMPKGGKLKIKSEKLKTNIKFVFTDTGLGISKEIIEKIWTPLFTTKAKGMGFGLAISKRFIEAHGGSISLKSALRKGTAVTVMLPIEPKIEGGEKTWVKPLESSLLMTMKT